VIVPEGYPQVDDVECLAGGHPDLTPASFAAGKRLLEFVDQHDDILFLISGGGSACVEWPLEGHSFDELTRINHELVASGRPIAEINAVRKQYSAIKGGRLGARVRGRCVTLVYSDVSKGRLADVASGPTIRDGQAVHLIADNSTLVRAAAEIAGNAIVWNEQIECDVTTAAQQLAAAARNLKQGEILVAGGEPTVAHTGNGKGGRCMELAARFALQHVRGIEALFGSSDGVDGNSGAAGAILPPLPETIDRERIETELRDSNSLAVVKLLGRAIMIPPTGNNLRDLVLLARA
jgi:glycerate 2-kinase